jgi:hypothetical protein
MTHWGSELGLSVLNGLAELYTSLVWESTLLLALCSDDIIPPGCKFGREDMEKLLPSEMKVSVYLIKIAIHNCLRKNPVGIYVARFAKLMHTYTCLHFVHYIRSSITCLKRILLYHELVVRKL